MGQRRDPHPRGGSSRDPPGEGAARWWSRWTTPRPGGRAGESSSRAPSSSREPRSPTGRPRADPRPAHRRGCSAKRLGLGGRGAPRPPRPRRHLTPGIPVERRVLVRRAAARDLSAPRPRAGPARFFSGERTAIDSRGGAGCYVSLGRFQGPCGFRTMDDATRQALDTLFGVNSKLYDSRGFARRIGYGKRGPRSSTSTSPNAWTRPDHAFSCEGMGHHHPERAAAPRRVPARRGSLSSTPPPPMTTWTAPHPDSGLWQHKISGRATSSPGTEAGRDRRPDRGPSTESR